MSHIWPGFLHILLGLLLLQQSVRAANLSQLAKKKQQQQQQLENVAPPSASLQQQQQYLQDAGSLTEQQPLLEMKSLGSEEDVMSDAYQLLHDMKQESRLPASTNFGWNPYAAAAPMNPFDSAPPAMSMPKMLPFIGYAQPLFIPFPLYIAPDMFYPTYPGANNELEDVVMSRAAGGRRPAAGAHRNSPIYYVRLPPTPYMFVPNMAPSPFSNSFSPLLSYQPMPTFSTFGSVFNLPVNFLANGKPSGIYQMNSPQHNLPTFSTTGLGGGFNVRPPTPSNPYRPTHAAGYMPPHQSFGLASLPAPQQDSKLTSLKRPFLFNGRPDDIYILPNNFNPLYNAEQSYY